ncbi:MAG: hypothetical protein C0485_15070 [Pirellula sp.]|nr:hypothetical protein [Pirellula sp.]
MRLRRLSICSFALTIAFVAIGLMIAPLAHAANAPPPREVDAKRAAAAGIRELTGQHIRLFTDLPSSPAVDELPAVFDAAIPLWAKYFDLDENSIHGQFLGFLISDREKFASLGLLPEENRDFVNGYARNREFWLVEQPSDYYRRHLMLHEGTHAFMQTQLGGAGPGWYMEGMAELLGTHRWQDGKLTVGVMPASKEATPMWGRIKVIRDAMKAGKPWPIEAVLEVDNRRQLDTEHYAWTWALTALLDGTPAFREEFRSLKQHVADPAFNEKFKETYGPKWRLLNQQWTAFVAQLDYGYDLERMAIALQPAVKRSETEVSIAADRGWQATGWKLEAGQSYRITAQGQFQIAYDGKPWPCEPNGVTIEYHDGRPLGALLGAIASTKPSEGDPSFAKPMLIGSEAVIQPKSEGVLCLRVNDSPAKLGDNAGTIEITLELIPATK